MGQKYIYMTGKGRVTGIPSDLMDTLDFLRMLVNQLLPARPAGKNPVSVKLFCASHDILSHSAINHK
ncbi:MAG: hypothetical protein OXD44_03185 [Gammaproteobacteria bacterium]|nr:hypothetical protein [Gammaproteobacteria bacterium]MCY4226313.1 hypothetical protein [Gammaproteobacteria bacterium]MCY4312696.1 hypothetical protein [Gammaproteobacteria bacterium]